MRTIIYGPPGTGKTHTLLGHIEKFLETTDPDKIGYFTFSKNAAIEGKDRAALKFKLSLSDDLPYFQTLHSFCFNQLGLSRDQVMKEKHYKELGEKMGIEIEGTQQDEDHDGSHTDNNFHDVLEFSVPLKESLNEQTFENIKNENDKMLDIIVAAGSRSNVI